ncbi:MAG: hypothetical protein ABR988_08195 [Terriglobales bacterium]
MPSWLKAKAPGGDNFHNLKKLARGLGLHTGSERAATTQDRRRLLSEARAAPRLVSGTMTNSRTVTSESST